MFKIKKIILFMILPVFILITTYNYFFVTGLATDEEMIEHFKKHRTEIEELVKSYREFDPKTAKPVYEEVHMNGGKTEIKAVESHHLIWKKQDGIKELMEKAGVDGVLAVMGDATAGDLRTLWLPNPYSIGTAKFVESIVSVNNKNLEEKKSMFIKYGMIMVLLEGDRYYKEYRVSKHFVFIPEIPQVKDGKLLSPVDINGKHYFERPLFSSINRIPIITFIYAENGEAFPCIYRQIEPQWFLRMCF
jgi:hypothetical protein